MENANQVSGAVDPFSKRVQNWKFLRGEVLTLEVPLAHQPSGNAKFAHGPPQNGLFRPRPEHIGTDIEELLADIGRATGGWNPWENRHSNGCLSRTIEVVNDAL